MLVELTELNAIHEDAWRRLAEGKAGRTHPFHTAAVATTSPDGGPTVRTVVLRRVDVVPRVLMFHTDCRSPKFAMIAARPHVAWMFYDPAEHLQLRLRTTATLHTADDLAEQQWSGVADSARACYQDPVPPGSVIPTMYRNEQQWQEAGRDNFAVVRCGVDEVDWLFLHHAGHRRARFTYAGGQVAGEWLAP